MRSGYGVCDGLVNRNLDGESTRQATIMNISSMLNATGEEDKKGPNAERKGSSTSQVREPLVLSPSIPGSTSHIETNERNPYDLSKPFPTYSAHSPSQSHRSNSSYDIQCHYSQSPISAQLPSLLTSSPDLRRSQHTFHADGRISGQHSSPLATPSSHPSHQIHKTQTMPAPTSAVTATYQEAAASPHHLLHSSGTRPSLSPPQPQHRVSISEYAESPVVANLRRNGSSVSRPIMDPQKDGYRNGSESVSPGSTYMPTPQRNGTPQHHDSRTESATKDGDSSHQATLKSVSQSRYNSFDSGTTPNTMPTSLIGSPLDTKEPRSPSDMPAERPPKKARREVPIWAQKAKNATPYQASAKNATRFQARREIPAPARTSTAPAAVANGPDANGSVGSGPRTDTSLSPWESCFTNCTPHEDLTTLLADFLFEHVVRNESIGTGSAGDIPSSSGQLEIEAKIGTLVDRGKNDRLRMPVLNEVAIDERTMDVAFESNMAVEQHAIFNALLNKQVDESKVDQGAEGSRPRVPVEYKHTREIDTFHDLPKSELSAMPPAVRAIITGHSGTNKSPKLRVTRDEKTGKIIARIIKARIKDLHVYCPRSRFDWRVSVNLEMNWDGDVESVLKDTAGNKSLERHKNRVSYRHMFSQIDLTQVQTNMGDSQVTHELEVELSSAEVRKQGQLAASGGANHYLELVKGFADNVRILARTKG